MALVFAVGCDRSQDVKYVNDTGVEITVYRYGRANPDLRDSLSPGESVTNTILANGGENDHVATVEATDVSGAVVFCHSYTVGELRKLSGLIRIRRQNDCG